MAGRSQFGSGACATASAAWGRLALSTTPRLAAFALASVLLVAPASALAATCTVTSTADYNPTTDPVITNTLRWCVEVIGNNDSTATDVAFSFTSGSGPWQIDVEYLLNITEADTTIDGSTQAGYTSVDPSSASSYGVILDGSTNVSAPLILIDGAGAEIRALRIKDHQAAAPPGPPPHAIQAAADGATIAQNRIENCSGGVAVLQDVQNTLIGGSSSTEGNVIATTTNSDGIILIEVGTGNVLQHNVIDQAYGSGIFALESAVATGLAALITIDDNTVTYSGSDGYLIFDSRASLEGNVSDYNTGAGFVLANFADVTDRMLVRDNYSRSNAADGFAVLGAEVSLWNNVVTGNGAFGVVLATMLGDDPSPDGTGPDDDTLAGGIVGSTSTSADENTITNNVAGGVVLLDSTIDNVDTVELNNTLSTNGDFEVLQLWPGLVQVSDPWGNPLAGWQVEVWPDGGPEEEEDPLAEGVSDENGYVGPDGFDPDDAETWFEIPSFVVFETGQGYDRFVAYPHEVIAQENLTHVVSYPWAASVSSKSRCQSTAGGCRYQVAEVEHRASCDSVCTPEIWNANTPFIGLDDREYLLCNANGLPSGTHPLVIGFHGSLSDPTTFLEKNGGCEMVELAQSHNFTAVFPLGRPVAGQGTRWNDCREEEDPQPTVDDVFFTKDLIDDLIAGGSVNADRVYAWGFSNGGVMAYRLATELQAQSGGAPKLAAVAAIGANEPVPGGTLNECAAPVEPGDILLMPGTAETFWMPYAGGFTGTDPPHSSPPSTGSRGKVLAIEGTGETVDFWSSEIGATTAASTFDFYDIVDEDDDGSTVELTTYGDWSAKMLKFYKIVGGGHDVPGSGFLDLQKIDPGDPTYCDLDPDNSNDTPGRYGLQVQLGCTNQDIVAAREIWNFFQPRLMFESWETACDAPCDGSGEAPWGFTDILIQSPTTASVGVTTSARMGSGGQSGLRMGPFAQYGLYSLRQIFDPTITSYRARFWLGTDELTVSSTGSPAPWVSVFSVVSTSGTAGASLRVYNDGGQYVIVPDPSSGSSGDPISIVTGGDTYLEVEWRGESQADAEDGFFCVRRIDELSTPSSVATSASESCVPGMTLDAINRAQIHVGTGVTGATGYVHFDEFESYQP